MDLTAMGNTLINELDKYPSTLTADTVLLENQPVLKNPTMKSIQIMIFSYFIMKNFVDNDNNVISDILLISARNKLTLLEAGARSN